MLLPAFVLLTGCEAIQNLKETVDGLTNPLVVEAMYLGVADPGPDLDLSGTDFAAGAVAQAFLADAANPTDLDNAPVTGAKVSLRTNTNGSVTLGGSTGGLYESNSDDVPSFSYQPGESVVLAAEVGEDSPRVSVQAPRAADIDLAEEHTAGQSLAINAVGQDYDGLLVVVLDADSGDVVWSNEPAGIQELYEFSHGAAELAIEIPANAFKANHVYAVGVAGMRAASQDEFDGMNSAISSFLAGEMELYPVSTFEL